MPDKVSCPPVVYVEIGNYGRFLSAWSDNPSSETQHRAKWGMSDIVKYIPRHVAEEMCRAAVHAALEAERNAQHMEESD